MARVDRDLFLRLCRARELLSASWDEPLSIEEVARRVTVSPFHFIRRFEAVFGATPHQLRTQARIERARRLLARGEHSVTEACMAVGFSSVGSFSTLFRRRVGSSPSAYRRAMRVLVAVPADLPRLLEPGCLTLMGRLPAAAFAVSEKPGSQPIR